MTKPTTPHPHPCSSDKTCYKCKKDPPQKVLHECKKCNKITHMKCDKTTASEMRHFELHPEDFECKSCSTCRICNRYVASNHHGIECTICEHWTHAKCTGLNDKDYEKYEDDNSLKLHCRKCLRDALPTLDLTPLELKLTMDGLDLPTNVTAEDIFLDDSQLEIIDKINKAIHDGLLTDNDNDDDDISPIDCKYYTLDSFCKQKFNSKKHFSIFHLNVHSIDLHITELQVIISKFDKLKFDFICITESKIQNGTPPKSDISIPGYQPPESMPTDASKGGVLIYVKNGINYKPRKDLNMHKSKELESFFIEVINGKSKNEIIGTIYRHPCMDPNEFVDDYMKPLNDKLNKENKHVYLTGDFNFDLLNTTHTETFEFFDTMMSSFLLPSITLPTKINKEKSTVIDNIFTNHINPEMKSGNLQIAISDHLPSFLIVPKDNQNHLPKNQNLYTRRTKNFDRVNFILDYFRIDWDNILELQKNDVNHSTKVFMDNIFSLLDTYMPLRKVTQQEYKRKFKPWINDHILSKINIKNKKFKQYMECKNSIAKSNLHHEFKTLKNQLQAETRQSKKAYYDKYFTDNKDNLQKTWKGIKEVINIKTKNFTHPTCIIDDNKATITDPKQIANSFNKYYTSIADDILDKRKFQGTKKHSDYLKNQLKESFAFYECDATEIESLISQLIIKKSYGPYSIPTDILHLLKKDISKPLSAIFNLSLSTGTHPDLLKIAKTIPIFKMKGSMLERSNYRPISLLSNLNKLLEKVMFNRVYKFLEKYKCIFYRQFGFREKHSTNHALIEITESIRKALDTGRFACGIFIDLQKAFDTVNHEILIDKLNYYGIRGNANKWFKSYLSNRSQFVSIQGHDSDHLPIQHGVPQGSVLGPLLFLIYINDLHDAIKYSSVYHFADDTNLLNINSSPKRMQKQVNLDLKSLYQWLLANKISLNCSKTELIFFHKPRSPINFDFKIKLNGYKLLPSDSIKYLGIYLDSFLSGSHHCDQLIKKLKRANGMLSKVRHYVPQSELKSIYYAIFSSHMTYGCQVWGQENHLLTKKIDTITKLQDRALRVINFKTLHDDPSPLYRSNHILKLKDFITLQNILLVYDYQKDTLPECFKDYFLNLNQVHPDKKTKHSDKGCLFVPSCKSTTYGLHSITHHCITDWNNLTLQLDKNLLEYSRHALKTKIFKHMIALY